VNHDDYIHIRRENVTWNWCFQLWLWLWSWGRRWI